MSRLSDNQVIGGRIINGYDYRVQAWVKDGVYQDCGHPASMRPTPEDAARGFYCCNAAKIAGLQTPPNADQRKG